MKFSGNKKGHFDLATLVITIIGTAFAFMLFQKNILKNIFVKIMSLKFKNKIKNEKTLRVRE
ncbi:hypothetical protein J4212_01800 [Candidatus Woesearchaeota archaeon]|nr:hypothetical protein [Candidatus Woesearchaeota archaeon]